MSKPTKVGRIQVDQLLTSNFMSFIVNDSIDPIHPRIMITEKYDINRHISILGYFVIKKTEASEKDLLSFFLQ